jgi:hypothetical protein
MPQEPQPREVAVDRILTNVSIAYAQAATGFVASAVFPPVPVEQQSGSYDVFPRGAFLRDEVKPRPLGGELELASSGKPTPQPYFCVEQGLADTIDYRQYANVRGRFDLQRQTIEGLTQKLLVRQDREWVSTYFKTDVWSQNYTGATSVTDPDTQALRLDEAAADPVKTFRKYKRDMELRTGVTLNVAVMGTDVYDTLLDNTDIIERIKYTQTGVIEEELLATMLGLDRIVIPAAVYNMAEEGLPDDIRRIASPKDMLLAHAAPRPGLRTPSAGYTFVWTGLIPGVSSAWGGTAERARLPLRYSDWFGTRGAWDERIVAPDLGIFFKDIVS